MKLLKIILAILLPFVSTAVIFIAGAFSNTTFDISKWGEMSLIMIPTYCCMCFFIVSVLSFNIINSLKD